MKMFSTVTHRILKMQITSCRQLEVPRHLQQNILEPWRGVTGSLCLPLKERPKLYLHYDVSCVKISMLWPKHNYAKKKLVILLERKGNGVLGTCFPSLRKVLRTSIRRFTHEENALCQPVPQLFGNAPWLVRMKSSGSPCGCHCSKDPTKLTITKSWPRTFSSVVEAPTRWWLPAVSLGLSQF